MDKKLKVPVYYLKPKQNNQKNIFNNRKIIKKKNLDELLEQEFMFDYFIKLHNYKKNIN